MAFDLPRPSGYIASGIAKLRAYQELTPEQESSDLSEQFRTLHASRGVSPVTPTPDLFSDPRGDIQGQLGYPSGPEAAAGRHQYPWMQAAPPPPTIAPTSVPRPTPARVDAPVTRPRFREEGVYLNPRTLSGSGIWTPPDRPTMDDPLVQEAVEASRVLETPHEIALRERSYRNIQKYARALETDPFSMEFVEDNAWRRERGLAPRPYGTAGAFQTFAEYNKTVLNPVVYGLTYGWQKATSAIQGALPDPVQTVMNLGIPQGEGYGLFDRGEAGFELEQRVDELRRNAIPYEVARENNLPIMTFDAALRQTAEEELLPWYYVEPLKVLLDPLGWPVGGVPFVRGVTAAGLRVPVLAGGGLVRLRNAGSAVIRGLMPKIAQAAGRPFVQAKTDIINANRAFFNVKDFEYRLTGNGRIDVLLPEESIVRAAPSAEATFAIAPIKAGLNRRQRLLAAIKNSAPGEIIRSRLPRSLEWVMTPENSYSTPAVQAMNEGIRKGKSMGVAVGRVFSQIANSSFKIDAKGRILNHNILDAAADIDIDLMGGAPTINDIAARLPYYWDALTPLQREAMENLRQLMAQFENAWQASGYPSSASIAKRSDIVTSIDEFVQVPGFPIEALSSQAREVIGFYIPRGTATRIRTVALGPVDINIPRPLKIPLSRSSAPRTPDFMKTEEFGSMSEGISGVLSETGEVHRYSYRKLRNVIQQYVADMNEAYHQHQTGNFLKQAIDVKTGDSLAIAPGSRIPKSISKKWHGLKEAISRAGDTQKRILSQLTPMEAEITRLRALQAGQAKRADWVVQGAAARSEKARLQAALAEMGMEVNTAELKELYLAVEAAHTEVQALVIQLKEMRKLISETRKLTTPADLKLTRALVAAEDELRDINRLLDGSSGTVAPRIEDTAGALPRGTDPEVGMGTPANSWEDWFNHLESYESLKNRADDLAMQSDALSDELEDLLAIQFRKTGELDQAKIAWSTTKRDLLVVSSRDREMAFALHDNKLLQIEQGRLERWAATNEADFQKALNKALGGQQKALDFLEASRAKSQELNTSLQNMSEEWDRAVTKAKVPPEDMDTIPLPGLGGYYFPDAVANAARVLLKDPEMNKMFGPALEGFNSLYRGARGTLDNSYMLVQMLFRNWDNPAIAYNAFRLSLHAWGVPRWATPPRLPKVGKLGGGLETEGTGETVIDSFFASFDDSAKTNGRLNSASWARIGLVLTGSDTEFQLGAGALSGLGQLPGVRNANRAFGALGDYTRLTWADDILEGMLKRRSMEDLLQSGELEELADMINNATGWAPGRFGGAVGDLLLFAPRFLQSRLNTMGLALRGLPSIATKPLGPYGWDIHGVRGTVGQRQAARSTIKMVGGAVGMTILLNDMQGLDTDFNPVRKSRITGEWEKNPNFLRVRGVGRDTSLLGTWDSLPALAITAYTEGPHIAMRSMASGVVTASYDFITGRTGIGESTWGYPDAAFAALELITPFAGDNLRESAERVRTYAVSGDYGKTAASASLLVADLHGAKSTELSLSEQITEERLAHGNDLLSDGFLVHDLGTGRERSDAEMEGIVEALDKDSFSFTAKDLPKDVLGLIDDYYPIRKLKEEKEEQARERGSEYQVWQDERASAKEEFHSELDDALEMEGRSASGQLKNLLQASSNNYGIRLEGIDNSYPELIANLEEVQSEEQSTSVFNRAMEDVFTQLYDPEFVDALGRFDFERYEKVEAEIRDKWGDYTDASGISILDSVFAEIRENEHPLQTRWREAREVLAPWFEIPDAVAERLIATPGWTDAEKAVLIEYLKPTANPTVRTAGEWAARSLRPPIDGERQDILIVFDRKVTEIRDWLRDETPTGYDPENARKINYELVAWDFAKLSPTKGRTGELTAFRDAIMGGALQDAPTIEGILNYQPR